MAEEQKDFIIKDKRIFFQETGEPRKQESREAEDEKGTGKEAAYEAEPSTGEKAPPLPEVSFSSFIFSLSSSALLHFGEIPDPIGGKKEKNLPMAKHSIDVLSMVEEKTRGNLTPDEEQLIKNILYDLRMRYVKETH
ncbi:MAG: hypothetical protein BA872_04255 [Desulfobacterales bacterium C00003060]|nr:MAG: hypothetical protein BA872_04255 [Desulfobacterales bacterium C00003060]